VDGSAVAYEVRIGGRLSRALRGEFADIGLAADDRPAETVLHGPVIDQAALYGLVRRIEALGLELVELRRLPAAAPPAPGPHAAQADGDGNGPQDRPGERPRERPGR
jgi:hypothetical protein